MLEAVHRCSLGRPKPENRQRPVVGTDTLTSAPHPHSHSPPEYACVQSCHARSLAGSYQGLAWKVPMTAQRTPLSYKREWPGTKMGPQMVTILVTLLLQCPQGLRVGIFRVTAGVGVISCSLWAWVLTVPHTHEQPEKKFKFLTRIY